MASTVSGRSPLRRSAVARSSSSRKNALPADRSQSRATFSGARCSPSTSRVSRSQARCESSWSRISSTPRSCQSFGSRSCTSARANPRTRSGLWRTSRSAASRYSALGASPQCRSSSTSTSGREAASAPTKSTHARRIWSPRSRGSCRAARSSTRPSSGNWVPTSSPRNSATRCRSDEPTCRCTRARSFCRCASRGSPSKTRAARRIRGASRPKGAPARSGSPRAIQTLRRGRGAARRARGGGATCRRRGRAHQRRARHAILDALAVERHGDRASISRSRPTNAVGRPSSARAAPRGEIALPRELEAQRAGRHLEARVEHAGRGVVEVDGRRLAALPARAEPVDRALDRLAEGAILHHVAAAGGHEGDRPAREALRAAPRADARPRAARRGRWRGPASSAIEAIVPSRSTAGRAPW